MSAMLHVRKRLLGVTQAEMARLTGVTQATVSRWERGELHPNLSELGKVRDALGEIEGLTWDDSVFFEPAPTQTEQGARA